MSSLSLEGGNGRAATTATQARGQPPTKNIAPSNSPRGYFDIALSTEFIAGKLEEAAVVVLGEGQALPLSRLFGPSADLKEIFLNTANHRIIHLARATDPNGEPIAILSNSSTKESIRLKVDELPDDSLIIGKALRALSKSLSYYSEPILDMVAVYARAPQGFEPKEEKDPALSGYSKTRSTFLINTIADNRLIKPTKGNALPVPVVVGEKQAGYLLREGSWDLTEMYQDLLGANTRSGIERFLFRTVSGEIYSLQNSLEGLVINERKWQKQGREPLLVGEKSFAVPSRRPSEALTVGQPFKLGGKPITGAVKEILVIEKRNLEPGQVQERKEQKRVCRMPAEFEAGESWLDKSLNWAVNLFSGTNA